MYFWTGMQILSVVDIINACMQIYRPNVIGYMFLKYTFYTVWGKKKTNSKYGWMNGKTETLKSWKVFQKKMIKKQIWIAFIHSIYFYIDNDKKN